MLRYVTWKLERKTLLGKIRHRWEKNIEMFLREGEFRIETSSRLL